MGDPAPRFEVVIPTRNRPAKLERCLAALAAAREEFDTRVLVADSSDDANHERVSAICAAHPFVTLHRHYGTNVAAARNACTENAVADVLISIDDDVYVDPPALAAIAAAYEAMPGRRVVGGAVAWSGEYHKPVVIRPIGYGRPAEPGEEPDFLVGAFFAYPRQFGLDLPWTESIASSEDIFVGALWRGHGIRIGFAPAATANHDPEHNTYDVDAQSWLVYVNLFDALIANPNPVRALSYEFLGFAAGLKAFGRSPDGAWRFVKAWVRGNRLLFRDRRYLRGLVEKPLTPEA
jgi:glycosyltransferase involved in cell wall biosynthesis